MPEKSSGEEVLQRIWIVLQFHHKQNVNTAAALKKGTFCMNYAVVLRCKSAPVFKVAVHFLWLYSSLLVFLTEMG